jgi:hypothetical protein
MTRDCIYCNIQRVNIERWYRNGIKSRLKGFGNLSARNGFLLDSLRFLLGPGYRMIERGWDCKWFCIACRFACNPIKFKKYKIAQNTLLMIKSKLMIEMNNIGVVVSVTGLPEVNKCPLRRLQILSQ